MAKKVAKAGKVSKESKPSKFELTKRQNKAKLLQALEKHDALVVISCEQAGVNPGTYYNYLEEDPEFAAQVAQIREKGNDNLESIILNLARHAESEKVQLDAAKTILGARAKDRGYGVERRENRLSADPNEAPPVQVVVHLPENFRTDGR